MLIYVCKRSDRRPNIEYYTFASTKCYRPLQAVVPRHWVLGCPIKSQLHPLISNHHSCQKIFDAHVQQRMNYDIYTTSIRIYELMHKDGFLSSVPITQNVYHELIKNAPERRLATAGKRTTQSLRIEGRPHRKEFKQVSRSLTTKTNIDHSRRNSNPTANTKGIP